MKKIGRREALSIGLAVLLGVSLGANAYLSTQNQRIRQQVATQRQRELTDVVAAMADIEVNLQKLLIATGAAQSVSLLGETAILAQHVESGLSRLPMRFEAVAGTMKFAGQVGEYSLALVSQMSEGSMLSTDDELQLGEMLEACRTLNTHLVSISDRLYAEPVEVDGDAYGDGVISWPEEAIAGDSAIEYPSLIYDGPFSDGRTAAEPRGLTGERVTRETAREAAARFAGTTSNYVYDAADSGGQFEAFGFEADTPSGRVSVQVTGVGAHLLWMMPQQAEYVERVSTEECLHNAEIWLADMGFGAMESCFVQQYDGMVVANFASVQDGVLLYPDQVKVQVSMEDGMVVGAECSQYLMNHEKRTGLTAELTKEEAQDMLSSRLTVLSGRLCLIPDGEDERLCWGFEGTFAGTTYWVFIDAKTGEAAQILCVAQTEDGETAI